MQLIQKQQGVVLITGLIFLVALTLIGTASLRGILLEEKMAGNLRDETLAFQAAEAALRSGEIFLERDDFFSEFGNENGLYQHSNDTVKVPVDDGGLEDFFRQGNGEPADMAIEGAAKQPHYIIEQLPSVLDETSSMQQSGSSLVHVFRVVAYGVGGTETATVVLQSTYRR